MSVMVCPSAAELDLFCSALLRLSVCLNTISSNNVPNMKLKVFICDATPCIRALVSVSRAISLTSSHVSAIWSSCQ